MTALTRKEGIMAKIYRPNSLLELKALYDGTDQKGRNHG